MMKYLTIGIVALLALAATPAPAQTEPAPAPEGTGIATLSSDELIADAGALRSRGRDGKGRNDWRGKPRGRDSERRHEYRRPKAPPRHNHRWGWRVRWVSPWRWFFRPHVHGRR